MARETRKLQVVAAPKTPAESTFACTIAFSPEIPLPGYSLPLYFGLILSTFACTKNSTFARTSTPIKKALASS